jgi:hypothetical protein
MVLEEVQLGFSMLWAMDKIGKKNVDILKCENGEQGTFT